MCGHLLIRPVEFGLIPVRLDDAGLRIIWNQKSGTTTPVFEGMHVAANPVRQLLRRKCLRVRVVAGTENGNEQLRFGDAAPDGIGNGQGLSCPIDKPFFAGVMHLAENDAEMSRPLVIALNELRVLPAVRVVLLELYPQ